MEWFYLAGPMTNQEGYNYKAFANSSKILRGAGINVRSPHEIDFGEDDITRGSKSMRVYLQAGIALLLTCSDIIMLPGWTSSRGAILELQIAIGLGMRVWVLQEDTWPIRQVG